MSPRNIQDRNNINVGPARLKVEDEIYQAADQGITGSTTVEQVVPEEPTTPGGGGGGIGTVVPSFPIEPTVDYDLSPGGGFVLSSFAFGDLSSIGLYANSLVVSYFNDLIDDTYIYVLNMDVQGQSTFIGDVGNLGGRLAIIGGKIYTSNGRYFNGTWNSWDTLTLSATNVSSFYDKRTDCMYVRKLRTSAGSSQVANILYVISSAGVSIITQNNGGSGSYALNAEFGDGHILYQYYSSSSSQAQWDTYLVEISSGTEYLIGQRPKALPNSWGVDEEGNEWGIADSYPGTSSPPFYSLYMTTPSNSRTVYWNTLSVVDGETGNYNRWDSSTFLDAGDFLIAAGAVGNQPYTGTSTAYKPHIWAFDSTGLLTKLWVSSEEDGFEFPSNLRWADSNRSSFDFQVLGKIYRVALELTPG
jgi:hypothetical protein